MFWVLLDFAELSKLSPVIDKNLENDINLENDLDLDNDIDLRCDVKILLFDIDLRPWPTIAGWIKINPHAKYQGHGSILDKWTVAIKCIISLLRCQ